MVSVAESLDVLVGDVQGGVGDFCLSLLPEGSLLRHCCAFASSHGLHPFMASAWAICRCHWRARVRGLG